MSKTMTPPTTPTPSFAASAADADPRDETTLDRVFIVDDHPVFRFGLVALLRAHGLRPCGEAEDARTALTLLPDAKANLVTMDISLAGGSGLALIKQICAGWPALPVLALSIHDEMLYAERALRAGAVGYLCKTVEPGCLIEGIRRALRGELVVSQAMTDKLLRRAIHKEGGEGWASPVALLSDRELEVFELMGQGLGTREVAEALHISVKTVETHQANMKNKLGVRSAGELLRGAVNWVTNPDKE